jgi:hypothetical protein
VTGLLISWKVFFEHHPLCGKDVKCSAYWPSPSSSRRNGYSPVLKLTLILSVYNIPYTFSQNGQ